MLNGSSAVGLISKGYGDRVQLVLRDGATMCFSVQGEGSPVVLLHSLGYDQSLYRKLATELSTLYKAVSYDLRGHGRSTLGTEPATLHTLATDLRELMVHLGVVRAHFVGQSIGGMVVLQAACEDLVDGTLCLLDTIGWTDRSWEERYRDRVARIQREGLSGVADDVAHASLGQSVVRVRPTLVDAYASQLRKCSDSSYIWGCQAMLKFDLRPMLPGIRLPVLVAAGTEDAVAPAAHARRLADFLSQGKAVEIPDSGHLPVMEVPEASLELLSQWFARHENL